MPPPIDPKKVLDLDVRRRIVDHVQAHPGLHLRGLADALDVAVSTLEYHCYQLQRHGHLTTREDGGFKAFYPAQGLDRRDKDILYVVRHEAPRRICAHLILHPGSTPKDLRAVVGLSAPTLSFHLKRLREAGLLDEEPMGRTKLLSLTDPERIANVLVTYKASFVDDAVDRFATAWMELSPPGRPGRAGGQTDATASETGGNAPSDEGS